MADLLISIIALAISLLVVYGMLREFPLPRVARKSAPLPARTPAVSPRTRRQLRVLMFGWEFPPYNSGGLGVACEALTRALSGDNVEIVFVLPKQLNVRSSFAKIVAPDADFFAAYSFPSPLSPYASNGAYATAENGEPLYGFDIVGEARRYARFGAQIARRERHDLIYAHDWLSFGAGLAAKRVSGRPLIAHVHATEFERTGGENLNQSIYDLEREGLHGADKVVAVSNRTKEIIVRQYGIPPAKVEVAWNGVDPAPRTNPDEVPRLRALKDAGYQLVLFLGRITLQKGPDYLLRAAKLVLAKNPRVYFIVAGEGDMRHQVMLEAAELGIADRVLFPGFLRDAERDEAYALADLFVMPSVAEPFGIAALEALRAGTPAIISKQSGVAEAVAGVLTADFWDTEKMAQEMLDVLSDPALAKRLGENGRRSAAELSWTRSADRVREIMDTLAFPARSLP